MEIVLTCENERRAEFFMTHLQAFSDDKIKTLKLPPVVEELVHIVLLSGSKIFCLWLV